MAPRVAASASNDAPSSSSSSKTKPVVVSYADDESTSVSAPINIFGKMDTIALPPLLDDKKITRQFIKDKLPARLFERSALRSLMHVAIDLSFVAAFGYGASHIYLAPEWARYLLWPLYWIAQGIVLTGVWVLAHECGHQAFSDSEWLNNTVGWVLHSALLVPFHSWRISHRNHHSNTCSMEHDEVFVPFERSDYTELVQDTPLYNIIDIMKMLIFGWPGYLIANFSGPSKYRGKSNSHFNPTSALFVDRGKENVEPATRWDVIVSDFGFLLTIGGMIYASQLWSVMNMVFYYFIPYLVVNLFLVLITYLQHTDSYIRHYRGKAFTWERGALATVDRSFGWLIDAAIHHIADTHVAHHLFHTMPFYNAIEATKILRRADVLGPYYLRDNSPIPQALYRSWSYCRYVDNEGDILEWRTPEDLARDLKKTK